MFFGGMSYYNFAKEVVQSLVISVSSKSWGHLVITSIKIRVSFQKKSNTRRTSALNPARAVFNLLNDSERSFQKQKCRSRHILARFDRFCRLEYTLVAIVGGCNTSGGGRGDSLLAQ